MTNPWAVAVMFFLLIFAGALSAGLFQIWLELHGINPNRAREYRTVLGLVMGVGIMVAFSFATMPAPVAPQQEEQPAPYPTETPWPECGWKDWVDVMLVNDEMLRHDVDALQATMTAWQVQPTATPVSIPSATPTATPVSRLCWACSFDAQCGPGLRCYSCSDRVARCVLSGFANSSCRSCIEAGR